MPMTKIEALEKAIKHFGNQRKMADALGLVPMTVSQWKSRGVPPKYCYQIERATNSEVTCRDLRPDIFPETKAMRAS